MNFYLRPNLGVKRQTYQGEVRWCGKVNFFVARKYKDNISLNIKQTGFKYTCFISHLHSVGIVAIVVVKMSRI